MKIVSISFSIVIMGWALLNALLLFGSSHSFNSIEWTYKFTVVSSLIVFPIDVILIYLILIFNKRNLILNLSAIISLIFTGLIFNYHRVEFINNDYSSVIGFLIFKLIPWINMTISGYLIVIIISRTLEKV